MSKIRRIKAELIAESITDYLEEAGWKLDEHVLFRVDPITGTKHNLHTALTIQWDRDINL